MERNNLQPTFLDGLTNDLGGKRTAEFFDKCNTLIPWEQLASPLKDMYRNNSDKGGASNWPVVMMIKCMLLQRWFGLSDPMLEEMLLDRLSFRRFVGLSLNDKTPDETTFVRFRNRLGDHGHASTLFDTTLEILERKGLVVKEVTLVDATIIEASKGKPTKDGLGHTKDECATYTRKHGKTYHGYKGHVATDPRGIVKDYRYDTAKVHDSQHIDDLIEQEKTAVYADSAYMDKERKRMLKERGVFCGIVERRVRGQDELTEPQKLHNRMVAGIRAIVEHPFAWIKRVGAGKARYRGLSRNGLDFALHLVAYNLKRSFSLAAVAT